MNVSVSRELTRPEIRTEYENARRALKNDLARLQLDEAANRVAQLAGKLDQGVARIKGELLATSLAWNETHQSLVGWLCTEHEQLFDMARTIIAARPEQCEDETLLLRMPAAALYHWGEAQKWAMRRERQDYQPLHALINDAIARDRQRQPVRVVADGRGRTVTLESLYFRALLLDRFAGGSLTRPQLEILDSWLWEWVPVLNGRREAPEGKCFRTDLDTSNGLREGAGPAGAQSLYLPLLPLIARRREVITHLHRGRIVPEHGCAADMRIEEHVAVLDQLGRAFDGLSGGAENRAQRKPGAGQRIEVWVGLAQILAHGLTPRPTDGAYKIGEEVRAAVAAGSPAQASMALAEDPSRRYLWLTDVSESGYGFEALGTDAIGIDVGDIVGWRKGPGEGCSIGRVARRMRGSSPGQVYLGVQLLTAAAQAVKLVEMAGEREISEEMYVFVPGGDDSGRRDAFLMTESRHRDSTTYRTRVDDRAFVLRMNRVRQRGRGWVLAGFEVEIVTCAPLAPLEASVELPRFRLPEDDDVIEDPYMNEVGARLLA